MRKYFEIAVFAKENAGYSYEEAYLWFKEFASSERKAWELGANAALDFGFTLDEVYITVDIVA